MQTPLMLAALKNKQSLVKQMLDYEASIDATDKQGKTALSYASKSYASLNLLKSFQKIKMISFRKTTMNKSTSDTYFNPNNDTVSSMVSSNLNHERGDDEKLESNIQMNPANTKKMTILSADSLVHNLAKDI